VTLSKIDLSEFVIAFPIMAAGVLGFFLSRWFQDNDRKNDKVTDHVTELATIKMTVIQIRDTVGRIEATVKMLDEKRESHREEFIKVRSQVDAAWKAIDKIQQRTL
jgi:hypothetical protein